SFDSGTAVSDANLWFNDSQPAHTAEMLAVIGHDLAELRILHIEGVVGIDEVDVLVDVEVHGRPDGPGLGAREIRRIEDYRNLFCDVLLLKSIKGFQSPNDFGDHEKAGSEPR